MKAIINLETKAKFFALYWCQDILCSDMYGDGGTIYSATMKGSSIKNEWLQRKPLSSISDEDLEFLAEIHLGKKPNMVKIDSTANKSFFTIEYSNQKCEFNENYDRISMYLQISDGVINNVWGYENSKGTGVSYERIDSLPMYDYLRSRGYLLPWMGLSCEELIEAGWAKYKE